MKDVIGSIDGIDIYGEAGLAEDGSYRISLSADPADFAELSKALGEKL